MKLKTLLDLFPALNSFAQIKLPVKISYRVAKAIKAIEPEIAVFEAQRTALLQELGVLQENGQSYDLGANASEFTKQVNDLVEEEVAINLPTVYMDELGNIEMDAASLSKLMGILILEGSPPSAQPPGAPLQ